MAREINRLSARAVATDKKPGLKADGGGLYLQVSPALTKSWIFRFTWEGNLRDRGLGSVHTVTLSAARDAAAECRVMVRDGIDPIERAKEIKLAGRFRVYGDAALPDAERHAAAIIKRILRDGLTQVNGREIRRKWGLPGLRTADAVSTALKICEEAKCLRECRSREGSNPGRQRSDYEVNPNLIGRAK